MEYIKIAVFPKWLLQYFDYIQWIQMEILHFNYIMFKAQAKAQY